MQEKTQTVRTESIPVENVRQCKFCKDPIAWLVGHNSGKKYPVNCPDYDALQADSVTVVARNDIHKCAARERELSRNE